MREKKEINIQIGERIRIARESAGLTQEALSERIDVSAQYVSDLERGVVGVSIQTLKNICFALGTSSDYLLFGNTDDDRYKALVKKCHSISDSHFKILCEIIDNYIKAVNFE